MSTWDWIPSDEACERCLGMEASYPDVPRRPHDHCHCDIVGSPIHDENECVQFDFAILENNFDQVTPGDLRHMKIETTLICCDGREFKEQFEHEWDPAATTEAEGNAELSMKSLAWEVWTIQNNCIGLA